MSVTKRCQKVVPPALMALLSPLALATSGAGEAATNRGTPEVEARVKDTLEVEGQTFRDLNANGQLDPYEDWRLSAQARVRGLVSQMTVEEKVGMMLIDTLNAEAGGAIPDTAVQYINDEKMTRFVFRNTVTATPTSDPENSDGRGGAEVTPYEAAQFMNLTQELAESTRLGIPALFKSNARNHFEHDPRVGINVASGSFSQWPKEAGLAATRDMELIAEFADKGLDRGSAYDPGSSTEGSGA